MVELEGKVIPYVPIGDVRKEEVKSLRFEIRNSKQENAFFAFSQSNSSLYKLCQLASEDPLLRLFFFLKPHIFYQPVEDYPIILSYPIFLKYDEEFLNSLSTGSVKSKIEEKRQKKEEVDKNIKDFTNRSLLKFFSVIISDKQVAEKLRRKRLRVEGEKINNLFSALFERHRKQFEEIGKEFADIYGPLYYSMEYYTPLLEAIELLQEAKENLQILSLGVNQGKELQEILSTSLSKLILHRIFRVRIESFCMECMLRKELEPCSLIIKYPSKPSLISECEKCGGKTIFHTIKLEAPSIFGPLLTESRLPEFIIGYTIAPSRIMKKIYIHKKVSMLTEKGPLTGKQVNIFGITKDGEILIIEVTTSKDLNKILEEAKKKEEALKEFPYNFLMFVSSSPLEKYVRYDNVRIFGAKHLPKLASHVEYSIAEMKGIKPVSAF
jgi:hypothetical protein